jgi:hypothetical protein
MTPTIQRIKLESLLFMQLKCIPCISDTHVNEVLYNTDSAFVSGFTIQLYKTERGTKASSESLYCVG